MKDLICDSLNNSPAVDNYKRQVVIDPVSPSNSNGDDSSGSGSGSGLAFIPLLWVWCRRRSV